MPFAHECFVDNIKSVWNRRTKTYSNTPGVDVRVPHEDGSTDNFEYLLPSLPFGSSDYFFTLVEALVKAGKKKNALFSNKKCEFRKAVHILLQAELET